MNLPIPRASIEQLVAWRNAALDLYAEAYDKIAEANAATIAANEMAARTSPGINNFNYGHEEEIKSFRGAVNLPERERYLRTARKLTDINAWAYIIERTDLERLMDTQAKAQLRDQMAYVPDRVDRRGQLITEEEIAKGLPEITVDNILATLSGFAGDADMIFRRGIANVFSKLDRRFRSHDGFKIGSRLILTRFFGNGGDIEYGATRDMVVDIERVFAVLDGKPEAQFTSALNAVSADRRGRYGPRQSEIETEYFRIKGYMNGNCHMWFQRDDLVEKVNKLLAEWYGEVIADGQTQEADPFADVKTAPAKYYGFYPTPDDAASQLFTGNDHWRNGRIHITQAADEPQLRILEPSAGTGNLARRCITEPVSEIADYDWKVKQAREWNASHRFDNLVDVVELQPHLADGLKAAGCFNRVYAMDFLHLSPEVTGLYDIVAMNPPFDRERDIDHVMHAMKFLKPGGRLHAILSAGTEFRETKKTVAFRALMEQLGATWEDLPANSFSEVGTNVNTIILRVTKPAA